MRCSLLLLLCLSLLFTFQGQRTMTTAPETVYLLKPAQTSLEDVFVNLTRREESPK